MAKPYSFVEFIEYRPYKKTKAEEKFTGVIPITLETLTPLHIGSGQKELAPEGLIYNTFYRWNEQCAIPGSTLKGCIRNIAESISHSCLNGRYREEKNKRPLTTTVNKEEGHERCITCDLFGSMKIKSKVSFGQLILEEQNRPPHIDNLPNFKGPHITPAMLKEGKLWGYKFYNHGKYNIVEKGNIPYEMVQEKAIFKGKVSYTRLTKEELMLLCFSLGLSQDIQPKLGYGKPGYYGSVKITSEVEEYSKWAAQYKEHTDSQIQQAVSQLIQILNYDFAKVKSDWIEGNY